MYHDLITKKSWELLQELKRRHKFILIGGWAVYLYAEQLKSKDIDIIVDYDELERLRNHHELVKNDRLKKYEIHMQEIDVDIYVPFFSDLGIPVESLAAHTILSKGFTVLQKEMLLILKQKAWLDRGHSLKGEKDKLDIIGLIQSGMDFKKYKKLLAQFHREQYAKELVALLKSITEVPALGLNSHQYSRLKKTALAALL